MRIVTLDFGSQSIGMANFRVQTDGGLVLHDYHRRQILAEPTGEGMRHPEMTVVLRQMIDDLHPKKGNISYSLSGQSVFVRFVKLPRVGDEKIERIVSFEAQQEVPFPIEEVVWDYQLIEGSGAEQIQVVLVAVKADLLEEFNGVIEETGLKTAIVDIAPMARYNAFRYSYQDLSGCSVLVNIGAHTTNLLFVEPERFFSRTVPIGGGTITTAIAKEFRESFEAAESRKQAEGSVALGDGVGEAASAEAARISKIAGTVLTRLHAGLMRSISHYRAHQLGEQPERIFLGGGGASMPGVREFFQEKTQLPVHLFNPLRNIAVPESAPTNDIAGSAHLLGELVGLALRSVGACPMELNLRPASVVRRQELEKRRSSFVMAAAAVVLGLLGWSFYYARAANVAQASANEIRKINASMQAAEAKIEELRKQAASLDGVTVPLTAAINDRFFWVQILEDLNARLPKENIWITELIPMSAGKPVGMDEKRAAELEQTSAPAPTASRSTTKARTAAIDSLLLRGLYLFNPKQQEVVLDYFRNLVGSPFFDVDPNNQARAIKCTIPNNTEWAFPYELRVELKKPLDLP
jgi:type IV pilus assembly protein PilM